MPRLHKEGFKIVPIIGLALLGLALGLTFFLPEFILKNYLIWGLFIVMITLVTRFFRVPLRHSPQNSHQVFSSADGEVVVIEETTEKEYFKDTRIQVSVFMSIYNVHINWAPVTGEIIYQKYHPGKFLPAWMPKSSELNERNTFVIRTDEGHEVLVRQIAGTVARRIAWYKKPGERVQPGDQLGFIRFGSRVDIFMPVGTSIKVKLGEKVKGSETLLAELP
ncbi:MAG: phosphatidylserine decarboxylase family protein [Bacteroidales bacterium]|jgi:phosphatidylserine decarboxylase|nr:phosphatidylserine decarboxylase family protein [Bacteroidales bacterium]